MAQRINVAPLASDSLIVPCSENYMPNIAFQRPSTFAEGIARTEWQLIHRHF